MEENGTYTLDLKQFRQLFPVSDCLSMGDDICVVNVRYDQNLKIMGHPCRFDGFLAVFCMSGGLRLTVNMTEFDLMKDSLFINLPGNIIRVSRPDVQGMEKLNFLVIAMTREFMGGFKVNMPKLIEKGMMLMSNPCIVLNEDEKAMARKYLRLASDVLKSNMMYKRESISSLISSVFFLAGGIMEQRVMEADSALPGRTDRCKVVEHAPVLGHTDKGDCLEAEFPQPFHFPQVLQAQDRDDSAAVPQVLTGTKGAGVAGWTGPESLAQMAGGAGRIGRGGGRAESTAVRRAESAAVRGQNLPGIPNFRKYALQGL